MNKDLPISELLLSYGDGIGTDEVLVPVDVIRAAVDRLEELEQAHDILAIIEKTLAG